MRICSVNAKDVSIGEHRIYAVVFEKYEVELRWKGEELIIIRKTARKGIVNLQRKEVRDLFLI